MVDPVHRATPRPDTIGARSMAAAVGAIAPVRTCTLVHGRSLRRQPHNETPLTLAAGALAVGAVAWLSQVSLMGSLRSPRMAFRLRLSSPAQERDSSAALQSQAPSR